MNKGRELEKRNRWGLWNTSQRSKGQERRKLDKILEHVPMPSSEIDVTMALSWDGGVQADNPDGIVIDAVVKGADVSK